MRRLHQTRTTQGFTLIELLVVIAIILILTMASVTGFQTFSNRSSHTSAAHTVLGALEEAHARTLAADEDTHYGVHFASTSVTIFEGDTYASTTASNDVRLLPARTFVSDVSLSGGATDTIFTRLSGDASATGTVSVALTADTGIFRTITISKYGLAEITN